VSIQKYFKIKLQFNLSVSLDIVIWTDNTIGSTYCKSMSHQYGVCTHSADATI